MLDPIAVCRLTFRSTGRAVGGRALEHSRAPAFPARRLAWFVRQRNRCLQRADHDHEEVP